MPEITLRLQTDQTDFDSDFFDNLYDLAKQYGIRIKNEVHIGSVQMIREDRAWLDQRDEERMAQSRGLQKDLFHLDQMQE